MEKIMYGLKNKYRQRLARYEKIKVKYIRIIKKIGT